MVFEDDQEPDNDYETQELWGSDGQDVRAARQVALEDIIAKLILALRFLAADESENARVRAQDILNVLPEALIDGMEGGPAGRAYTSVFDRIALLIDLYQDPPTDDENGTA